MLLLVVFFFVLNALRLVHAVSGTSLTTLLNQLDDTSKCNSQIISSSLHIILQQYLQREKPNLLLLAKIITQSSRPYSVQLPKNANFVNKSPVTMNSTEPLYILQLYCNQHRQQRHTAAIWHPILIYPLETHNSFLVIKLPNIDLYACTSSNCTNSKCTWTVHGGTKVFAQTCCAGEINALCRELGEQGRNILVLFNAICAIVCILLVPVVIRERRRNHEARGWALMEIFLFGAAALYSILLIDWLNPTSSTCYIAIWLRQIGFSTFYGSILLKIYRNLQEYRVRKAHHVSVKEEDLLKYLACLLSLTVTSLVAWTVGSWPNDNLWNSAWPQCDNQAWIYTWYMYELIFLLYGLRLCYKARNSTWLERWQFTIAVCLETVVTLLVNLIRYSIRYTGHSDTLMTITFIQLHLTVSINIVIIIAPKFYLISSESMRRTQTLSGSSSKAHPSLAKLRDNLLNGTVDFNEIPIADMNPEDIRAELKRVYTQLRMYKLKNIYQDNPHISKRKGGKKSSDKGTKSRRISLPPTNSPKVRRVDEEERSDLTVESAPHNVFLSTYKLQLEPNQSVRV